MNRQLSRLPSMFALCLFGASLISPLEAKSQLNQSESIVERQLDSTKDLRIAKNVSLDINSISLQRTFEELTKATGVQLNIEPEINQRRVIIKCKDQSLFSMLNAIATATHCVWLRGKDDKLPYYTLYRTEKRKKLEKQMILISENRVSLIKDELMKAEAAAFSDPQNLSQARIVADLYASFNDDVKKQTLQISNEFFGTHDGSPLDMKYYFIGAKSYDKLSPELQKLCRDNIVPTAFELEHGLNSIGEASRLRGSYIGIQAAWGTYSLAVARKGEEVASSFAVTIHRKGLPGIDVDDDSDPELNEQAARGNLVSVGGLTLKQGRMKFTGADFPTKTLLSSLLDSLFKKSSIPVVSDSFFGSEASFFSNLLTDKPQYSLAETLELIGKAHAHEFRVVDGVLVARTVANGLDLRAELPSELMRRLSAIALDKKKTLTLTLRDALEVASLSEAQFEHILYNFSVPIPQSEMLKVKSSRPVLRLFGSLSKEQIEKAFTVNGFRSADMSATQRPLFDRIAYIGIPGKPPFEVKGRPQGVYLFRQTLRSGKNRISLSLVSGSDEDDVRVFVLPILESEGVMTYAPE